jgi:hypothetical protein
MAVDYEWWAEECDRDLDAVALHFFETRAEAEAHRAVAEGCVEVKISLVRDVFRDGDLVDRQWAYLKGGRLPTEFSGGARVPARFLAGEVGR